MAWIIEITDELELYNPNTDKPVEKWTFFSNNAHVLAILRAFFLELDVPVAFGEQRVITTNANIHTGVDTRAALSNDDIPGNNRLADIFFDAQPFGIGIATVLSTAACFFMSHFLVPVVLLSVRCSNARTG